MMRLSSSSIFVCLSLVAAARASFDPSHTDFDYGYSQSFSLDLSSDLEQDEQDYDERAAQIVTSSLLFPAQEEECYVSSLTLMSAEEPSSGDSFLDTQDLFFENFSSENEDDDDDDNDGSSSMLSNSNLKRVPVSAGSPADVPTAFVSKKNSGEHYYNSHESFSSAALQLRGGASVPALGAEALQKLVVVALVTLVYEGACGRFYVSSKRSERV
jgi:hypothetical protein